MLVGNYTLSGKADEDIVGIAAESLRQWGQAQAEAYVLGLHALLEQLADFPEMGRDASAIRPGYRRMETASHVVFYRKTAQGIFVVRVLHERMDFPRHL